MSQNLGQVAAILQRETLPSGELPVIIRKVDGSGAFEDYYLWKNGAWRSFTTLFGATHLSSTAPSDTTKVWLDDNFTPPLIKTYDSAAEEWKALSLKRSLFFDSNFSIDASHDNAFLNVENTGGSDVEVTLGNIALDEFETTLSRLDNTAVTLAPASSSILFNGVSSSLSIAARWTSIKLRKLRDNQYLVEGNMS